MNATPDPVQMPFASFKTGCTPADRSKADDNEMFQKRCESCLGIIYGQVVPDPEIRSTAKYNRFSGGSVTTATVGRNGTVFGVDAGSAT